MHQSPKTYRPNVSLVELRSDNRCLDIILDLRFVWKASQRGRQGLLDVLVGIASDLYLEASYIQVGKDAVM